MEPVPAPPSGVPEEKTYDPEPREPKDPFRKNKRKLRALRDQPSVREPRRARLNTLLAFDANNIKDNETLRKYGRL